MPDEIATSKVKKQIRELGFTFKNQANRTHIYRRKGTTDCVYITNRKNMDAKHVEKLFKQCGCTDAEINKIMKLLRNGNKVPSLKN